MPALCFYFQVHQPYRLAPYSFFDLGHVHHYENDAQNEAVLNRVVEECYLPANALLGRMIAASEGKVRVGMSLTGTVMAQMAQWRPDALASFAQLATHKQVDLLGETYYHSLAALFDEQEFHRQRKMHQQALHQHLGRTASVFRHTELLYSDGLAQLVAPHARGILGEGVDWYMEGRTTNRVYKAPKSKGLGLLLRNHKLSDSIAFRFQGLTADAFLDAVVAQQGEVVNVFLDYETFGEHLKAETGIFDFLEAVCKKAVERKIKFVTPTKAIEKADKPEKLSLPTVTSWADEERDLSAWHGNEMQRLALRKVYELGPRVRQHDTPEVWEQWGRLQTSDHFYYMSNKGTHDGQVHSYFNAFDTPYDAYIHYMNVLSDFELELKK